MVMARNLAVERRALRDTAPEHANKRRLLRCDRLSVILS
jgi:hypothetical protein